MRVDWIKKEGNTDLLILALGWGSSKEVVGNQVYGDYDVLAVCDYRNFDVDFKDICSQYKNVSLFAWSFGVWASEQAFGGMIFKKAVAVGGTPEPIDRQFGIAPRAFDITLQGILNEGVAQFVVRMCGRHLRDYLKNFSTRSLEDVQDELQILGKVGRVKSEPQIKWSQFLILEKDLIFPPRSIENYCKANVLEFRILENTPHYPFYDQNFIECAIKS